MTSDSHPDDTTTSGDQIDARNAPGFVNNPGGPVSQNFGDQRTVRTGGGAYVEGNLYQQAPSLAPALHQLRAPVGDFVGRSREIDQIVQHIQQAVARGAATSISGVRGMGGIGKTELAYAVAQRLAALFPDAQLLVELRGASSTPLAPAQALQTVIRAFEREARLPDDPGQLTGLYRSLLAGKRVLILADDAHDAAQVRPLLPPPGCALLVTSRNRFGLPGMAALDLGTLPAAEAATLLLDICPRVGAHAAALAMLCGYLPLALRVSAGVLEVNDTRGVPGYIEQLASERLKHLADPDDPQAGVEASLQLSYAALEPDERAALCQLSVFPTSFDPAAAVAVVALAGDPAATLERLRRHSLLEWDEQVQRFSLHDLVRAFAAARLEDADAVRLQHARYYAQVAWRAGGELYNQGGAHLLAGLSLFDQERIHIEAGWSWAATYADTHATSQLVYDYANAVLPYIGPLRYPAPQQRIPLLEAQLAAARRLDNRAGEGNTLNNLGGAYRNLRQLDTAIEYYQQGLAIMREVGDRLAVIEGIDRFPDTVPDELVAKFDASLMVR
jgi:tetratricopeptide (TPR) repeat protein